uniref:Serine aminopeptidase S33 domain-containing protein n=1 Tax=Eutreptiella gymnastica TaxID=73025 RepID=A0A7S1IK62_9EUGL|mmetsp:Transcript_22928/g.41288  ORF Transcript_22928/g.41288 Transcript_22928/m.41288 type:complete len:350 (+) Transcript_22928:29-1078(+)
MGFLPKWLTLQWVVWTSFKIFGFPYMMILILLMMMQRQLIYQKPLGSDIADPTLTGGKLVNLSSRVLALHFPVEDDRAPTVVFFHGNGDQLGWGAAFLGPHFNTQGCGFYGIEYPGYGLATGRTTEMSIHSAAKEAIEFLTLPEPEGLGVRLDQVVLFGQSIGAAVAMEAAIQGLGNKVVLLSAFLSIPHMAQEVGGRATQWLSLDLLRVGIHDEYDNMKKAPGLRVPVSILHGDNDTIVPFNHSVQLHQLIPGADFHRLENVGHNDVFFDVESESQVIKIVAEFAKRGMKSQNSKKTASKIEETSKETASEKPKETPKETPNKEPKETPKETPKKKKAKTKTKKEKKA